MQYKPWTSFTYLEDRRAGRGVYVGSVVTTGFYEHPHEGLTDGGICETYHSQFTVCAVVWCGGVLWVCGGGVVVLWWCSVSMVLCGGSVVWL